MLHSSTRSNRTRALGSPGATGPTSTTGLTRLHGSHCRELSLRRSGAGEVRISLPAMVRTRLAIRVLGRIGREPCLCLELLDQHRKLGRPACTIHAGWSLRYGLTRYNLDAGPRASTLDDRRSGAGEVRISLPAMMSGMLFLAMRSGSVRNALGADATNPHGSSSTRSNRTRGLRSPGATGRTSTTGLTRLHGSRSRELSLRAHKVQPSFRDKSQYIGRSGTWSPQRSGHNWRAQSCPLSGDLKGLRMTG
jgi:hypothetical protein